MANQFTKSVKGYDPKKDQIHTLKEKINMVFTDHQIKLTQRPDVTKSLILAMTKLVDYKQDLDEVVSKWVGKDVDKFLKSIPLITVKN